MQMSASTFSKAQLWLKRHSARQESAVLIRQRSASREEARLEGPSTERGCLSRSGENGTDASIDFGRAANVGAAAAETAALRTKRKRQGPLPALPKRPHGDRSPARHDLSKNGGISPCPPI